MRSNFARLHSFFILLAVVFAGALGVARADSPLIPISVDVSPTTVAVNPITNRIYIGHANANSLEVIDGATNRVITTVATPQPVVAMAINPSTNRVYLVCHTAVAFSLAILNEFNNTIAIAPDAGEVLSVAVDAANDRVYVGERSSSEIRMLSGDGQEISLTSVSQPPTFLALNPVTNLLYAGSSGASGTFSVVDPDAQTETLIPTGLQTLTGIVVNPATNKIFVRYDDGNHISVVDGQSNTSSNINLSTNGAGVGLALNPVTNQIYATSVGAPGTLNVLDATTGVVSSINLGNGPNGLALNTRTNKIYVSNATDGSVSIIDGATNTATVIPVGTNPSAVGVNPLTNRVFVTNSGANTVSAVDGASYAVLPLSGFANVSALAVDPATAQFYVTTATGLSSFDGNTRKVNAVGFGSTSLTALALNKKTHKVYAAEPSTQSLLIFDPNNFSRIPFTINVGMQVQQIAVDEVANRIYLTGIIPTEVQSMTLKIVDGARDLVLQSATFPAGVNAAQGLVVDPGNHKAYIATPKGLFVYGPNLSGATVTSMYPYNGTAPLPGPPRLAVNRTNHRVYLAAEFSPDPANNLGSLRVFDGDTNAIIPGVALATDEGTNVVAVDSQSGRTYALNKDTQQIVILDAAGTAAATFPFGQTPVRIAVDEAHDKAYVLTSQGRIYVFTAGVPSGAFQAVAANGLDLALNPLTEEILVVDTATTTRLVTSSPPGQSALATFITPFDGDSTPINMQGGTALPLQGVSLLGPNRVPVTQVYYQFDRLDQRWEPGFPDGDSGDAFVSTLGLGTHTMYAFSTVGQLDASAASAQGSSPIVGQISTYNFEIRPGAFFFLSSAQAVTDNAGHITLTVFRDFSDPAVVTYKTVPVTAQPGANYVDTQGTLVFALYEFSKTITIPILNRDFGAPVSTFEVQLAAVDTVNTKVTTNEVLVSVLDDKSPDLSLSLTTSIEPSFAPFAFSSIVVNLSPLNAGGQWRLFGELAWRNSGTAVDHLTSGNYKIEFKTVDGFVIPPTLTIPVSGFSVAVGSGTYTAIDPGNAPAPGVVKVTLVPGTIGGWRVQGEAAFRNSADSVSLSPGDYILEFKTDATHATPPARIVHVVANTETDLTVTYLIADAIAGLPPTRVLDVQRTNAPLEFLGQVQTDAGFGSGFVPLDRVVVTAAHVLFDDGSLAFTPGVRWLFQHERGKFEAPPQIPRGSYLFQGYAAQRQFDHSPGVSSNASQQLDVAALYFLEPAGRGGASGYLASNSALNSWLTGPLNKQIAGYPVEQVPEGDAGTLYATPRITLPLEFVSGAIFRTTAVTSFAGNSGGPLLVTLPNGTTFPAAVYLGGTQQTVVRAIDSQVVDIMNRAQISGSGGANNTGGGIAQVDNGLNGSTQFALGSLKVQLKPAGAVSAGARWRISSQTTQRVSNQAALGLPKGAYTVLFSDVTGYITPPTQDVNVDGAGLETPASATYTPTSPPAVTSALTAMAITNQPFRYQITGTFDPTSFTATPLPDGLHFSGTTGLISGTVMSETEADIVLTALNGRPGAVSSTLHLSVVKPGQLTVSAVGSGSVSKGFLGTTSRATGSTLAIKATPKAGFLFDHWSDLETGATLATTPTFKFTVLPRQSIQVTFVPNLFIAAKGAYVGLLQGGKFELSGLFKSTLGANGSFSASVALGNGAATLKNSFDSRGHFAGTINLSDSRLIGLALDVTSAGVITGRFTDLATNGQYPFAANRGAKAAKAAVGAFTTGLPRAAGSEVNSSAVVPGGTGFGRITVSAAGSVALSGRLGDGTVLSGASHLDANGAWPLYFLAKNSQVLLGGLSPAFVAPGFTGQLGWYRTATDDAVYPDGYSLQLSAAFVPFKSPAIKFTAGEIIITDPTGGLLLTETVTISTKGVAATTDPAKLKLTLTMSTGLFTGTFLDSNAKTQSFFGVIHQDTQQGTGLYLDTNGKSGALLLKAAP